MEEQSPARKILVAVVEGRRQRGRPKLRWEDGVMEDATKLGVGREIGGMLQGIQTAGRSFWRRPWLKRGCCADDDELKLYLWSYCHSNCQYILLL